MNSIVNIFSDEVFCPLFKRHLVPLTGHYVRTKLSHTARNKVNFLLQENATFVELDKMATEQFWFEICRLSHIGCIARKSIPAAKIHHSTVEQLKLAIIDYTEIFFFFFYFVQFFHCSIIHAKLQTRSALNYSFNWIQFYIRLFKKIKLFNLQSSQFTTKHQNSQTSEDITSKCSHREGGKWKFGYPSNDSISLKIKLHCNK